MCIYILYVPINMGEKNYLPIWRSRASQAWWWTLMFPGCIRVIYCTYSESSHSSSAEFCHLGQKKGPWEPTWIHHIFLLFFMFEDLYKFGYVIFFQALNNLHPDVEDIPGHCWKPGQEASSASGAKKQAGCIRFSNRFAFFLSEGCLVSASSKHPKSGKTLWTL